MQLRPTNIIVFFVRQCLHVGLIGLLQSCIFLTVIQNILATRLGEMVGNRNIPIVLRAFCSRRFGYVELSVAGLNNDWNVLSRAHLVGVKGRPEQITFGLVAFLSVPKIGPCAVILLQKCVVFLLKFLQDRLDIIGIWAPGVELKLDISLDFPIFPEVRPIQQTEEIREIRGVSGYV